MPLTPIHYLAVSLLCYLFGSFPTGVVISKKKYGLDVREMGSGNIGATNVTRVFGWYAGILTLVIDFAKGFLPVFFLKKYFPEDPWVLTVAAISLVVGHCFSLYLKFRGGKGVATGLGTVAAVLPLYALLAVVIYLVTILISKISAVGSLVGILSALVYLAVVQPELPITIMVLGVSLIILMQHTSNIKRLVEDRKAKK